MTKRAEKFLILKEGSRKTFSDTVTDGVLASKNREVLERP